MKLEAPQIVFLSIIVLNLMASSYFHGKPKEGNNSVWNAIIGVAISVGVVAWGGFFSN